MPCSTRATANGGFNEKAKLNEALVDESKLDGGNALNRHRVFIGDGNSSPV